MKTLQLEIGVKIELPAEEINVLSPGLVELSQRLSGYANSLGFDWSDGFCNFKPGHLFRISEHADDLGLSDERDIRLTVTVGDLAGPDCHTDHVTTQPARFRITIFFLKLL